MDERTRVHKWLSEGVTKAEIARRLKIPRTTLLSRIEQWEREGGFVIPPPPTPTTQEAIKSDRKIQSLGEQKRTTDKKYRELIKNYERLKVENEALSLHSKEGHTAYTIKPKKHGTKHKRGIANALLSDYHLEERVQPQEVEGLNEYNLAISKKRLEEFFQTVLRYINIERQNTDLHELVIWFLGDMITGWLHEESIHTTLLPPARASVEFRRRARAGLQFLLDNSDLNILVPCVSGNHGRITRRPNHATEEGNSLEFAAYSYLEDDFANEERIKFLISESGFVYVDQFGYVVRGSHGHRIRYQGGVQGIGVPASKRINQWNKTRYADLDVFGHHHTAQDGENFVCNGSIIGFNSYAYKEGFSFQPPEQRFFLVHEKWGRRNVSRSIFFET